MQAETMAIFTLESSINNNALVLWRSHYASFILPLTIGDFGSRFLIITSIAIEILPLLRNSRLLYSEIMLPLRGLFFTLTTLTLLQSVSLRSLEIRSTLWPHFGDWSSLDCALLVLHFGHAFKCLLTLLEALLNSSGILASISLCWRSLTLQRSKSLLPSLVSTMTTLLSPDALGGQTLLTLLWSGLDHTYSPPYALGGSRYIGLRFHHI